MEQATVDGLVKEVRITLDENQTESAYLESNTDNMELDEIIRSKLIDAARSVIETAPVDLLEASVLPTGTEAIHTNEDGSGYVELPDDFLRLVRFKLKNWKRAVIYVEEEGSEGDEIQRNEFTRGTYIKPACVFSHDSGGNRIMEYFTAGKGSSGGYDHTVETALYVPVPSIDNSGGSGTIGIPHLLRPCIVNYCAGLTEVTRGNTQQADVFFKIATSYYNKNE